jgi:hypothetical protein
LWPLLTPEDHDLKKLESTFNHYIRKLSCKYDPFWLSGSGEGFLNDPNPF